LRIALFADRLELGGVETHILSFASELLRRGHHILLYSGAAYQELLDYFVHGHESFQHVNWSQDNPTDDVRQFCPDIIHAHPFTSIVKGYMVARELGKPLIVSMHGLYDFGLDRSPLGWEVSRDVCRIIAADMGVASLLLNCVAHPEKVSIIRNCIDLTTFHPLPLDRAARLELDLEEKWFTIVVVSRLGDNKETSILQLLRCAPELSSRLGGLNIVIVGDGPWITHIRDKATETMKMARNLRVNLTGRQLDVRKFLGMADLVMACGRAALEAMACQRPVFTANAFGYAGVIDSNNHHDIFLHRRGYAWISDEELTSQLIDLANNEVYRKNVAEQGLEVIRCYHDLDEATTQLERIYQQYV